MRRRGSSPLLLLGAASGMRAVGSGLVIVVTRIRTPDRAPKALPVCLRHLGYVGDVTGPSDAGIRRARQRLDLEQWVGPGQDNFAVRCKQSQVHEQRTRAETVGLDQAF